MATTSAATTTTETAADLMTVWDMMGKTHLLWFYFVFDRKPFQLEEIDFIPFKLAREKRTNGKRKFVGQRRRQRRPRRRRRRTRRASNDGGRIAGKPLDVERIFQVTGSAPGFPSWTFAELKLQFL